MNNPTYTIQKYENPAGSPPKFYTGNPSKLSYEFPDAIKFNSKREAVKVARELPIFYLRVIKNYGLMDEEVIREIE